MIDCLVFSKDRAAQLDLLLRTLVLWGPRLSSCTIQWTASDLELATGYAVLQGEWSAVGHVTRAERWAPLAFELEDRDGFGFERSFRQWLERGDPTDPIMFLVDDDLFYRQAPPPRGIGRMPFSYRGGDYWYPFSLDGNVYVRQHVRALLHGLHFSDPNELEQQGWEHRERLPFATCIPSDPPCLVGVPANRVSKSSGLPHSGYDVHELNARYLRGHRFPIPELAGPLPAHAFIADRVYA